MLPETTVTINFHGEELVLHPEAAIWWASTRTLILSDVHLGKSAAFRTLGIPVPEGELREDLLRIERLVEQFDPASLHIVGDLLHSKTEITGNLTTVLNDWLGKLPCPVILIRGNHDPSLDKLKPVTALKSFDFQRIGPILLVHDPSDAPDNSPIISGHLHPHCRIGKRPGPSIKVPCFYRNERCLVLPAFGTFTSGNVIRTGSSDSAIYPIVQGRVFPTAGR